MTNISPSGLAIVGSFSIDSVLTPTGRALPAKPGGNALWSAMGAYLGGRTPHLVARVGRDYPPQVLDRLDNGGFDLSALVHLECDHPVRVSYAHRPDGGRLHPVPASLLAHLPNTDRAAFIDTTGAPETLVLGAPAPADIPEAWLDRVAFWHLPLLPLERHRALVALLAQARGVVQTDCPARHELVGDPFARLAQTLPKLDVFLPSTSDLEVVAPGLAPRDALTAFRAHGAGTVVLKAGPEGVFVDDGGQRIQLDAYLADPIDPTGAGDAFCGGFLAGRVGGADLIEAAALGSACASFALATANPLDLFEVDRAAVNARARILLKTARPLPPEARSTEGMVATITGDRK
ncbi:MULTISPECIES: carbohydrate kinase family protein [Actibacterium]|uniref:Ribokinase n=1 Tax=Actibacterium naphthalenivorans TaxID=1614693 RepID=A0A840CE36_9RHOB|nr:MULTISPECIES: carbohydrate kinase family protein [Actibacterium]ALG89325.1 hypothetical protein TQ29_02970 [Actibacterium sp. EMB200-NS6]MBB4021066.1 ribokinase [Actibacterium naphthalenivorans]